MQPYASNDSTNATITNTNLVIQQKGKVIGNADIAIAQQTQGYDIETENKTITKEHAIAIANSTEGVQEFLKLYPDSEIFAFKDFLSGCKGGINATLTAGRGWYNDSTDKRGWYADIHPDSHHFYYLNLNIHSL